MRASTNPRIGFTLLRARSPGFGSRPCDSRHFHTPPLIPQMRNCGHVAFATAPKLTFLASPQKRTPWPVFPNGRHDPGRLLSYYRVATDSFKKRPSFEALSLFHHLVLGSFHLPFEMLFSFPSRYCVHYRSRDVFRVGNCYSQLSTPNPRRSTQGTRSNTFQHTLTGLSPSLAPRSRGLQLR